MQRKPKLLWYQLGDTVNITVDHRNIKNEKIQFNEKDLLIEFNSNGIEYSNNYDLEDSIIPEGCEYTVNDRNILIFLEKNTKDVFWNYLVTDNKNYKNYITIDWANWVDDIEEIEDIDNNNSMRSVNNSIEQLSQMPGGLDMLNNMDHFRENMNLNIEDKDEDLDNVNDISNNNDESLPLNEGEVEKVNLEETEEIEEIEGAPGSPPS